MKQAIATMAVMVRTWFHITHWLRWFAHTAAPLLLAAWPARYC